MNERLLTLAGELGQIGQTLSTGELLVQYPFGVMLVYLSGRPHTNDADLTIQVTDATVGVGPAAALAIAVAATPGVWKSKHFGGSDEAISIAKDHAIGLDFTGAASGTRVQYVALFLIGEK